MATTLFPFQLDSALVLRKCNGVNLVASEMGLGKSLTGLYWCYKMKRARPIIVVCPASLKWNWEHEASHHLDMMAEVLSGKTPPENSLMRSSHPIVIVNYDILVHWLPYLISLKPQVVIWDEAHYCAHAESQRYKALKRLITEAKIPHRIAMSGTPLTNRPAELWTTLNLLWPKEFPSYVEYGFDFCEPKMVRGKIQFGGARNLDKLHAKLKALGMIRLLKKDVMPELGNKVPSMVPLEIMDRKQYIYARDHFMRWLQETNPARVFRAKKNPHLVKIGYLLRLVVKLKRFAVLQWIEDFLSDSDEKLVVFSSHTRMLSWLGSKFNGSSVTIDGSVTGIKRHHAVDRFQKVKSVRLALCNPIAGGVGITLTSASNVAYTDLPWTPGALKQSADRIHRIGQKKPCFIWYLASKGTIEEKMFSMIQNKQEILDKVLDGSATGADFAVFNSLLKK